MSVCEFCGGPRKVTSNRFCSRPCIARWNSRRLAGRLPQQQRQPNEVEIDGEVARIIIRSAGEVFRVVVDTADLPLLTQYTWRLNRQHMRPVGRRAGRKHESVYIHRLLMGSPVDMVIDHINRDTLDNRRSNLRVCTNAENAQNQGARRGRSLPRGVTWKPKAKLFKAEHKLNYKNVHIGYFKTAEEADAAARAWRAVHMPHATG